MHQKLIIACTVLCLAVYHKVDAFPLESMLGLPVGNRS